MAGRVRQPDYSGANRIKKPPDPSSSERESPYFCLSCAQAGYSIGDCDSKQRASYANKLAKWGSMTWLDMRLAPKHGLGFESIHTISVPLPDHVPEDAMPLIAFRFHDHLAVIGYRTERIFHAVWFDRDPKGKIYRH